MIDYRTPPSGFSRIILTIIRDCNALDILCDLMRIISCYKSHKDMFTRTWQKMGHAKMHEIQFFCNFFLASTPMLMIFSGNGYQPNRILIQKKKCVQLLKGPRYGCFCVLDKMNPFSCPFMRIKPIWCKILFINTRFYLLIVKRTTFAC